MDTYSSIDNATAGELSTRPLRPLIIYFDKLHGKKELQTVFQKANLGLEINLAYLYDENNWVSFEVGQRIIDILDENSDDPEFVKHAGLLVASKEMLGFAYTAFKAFGSPKACYGQLFKGLSLFNRVGEFSLLKLTNASLCFSYKSLVIEPNIRFSEYRMAQFASVPTVWGLPPASIKKLQCQVTEDVPESVYELKWQALRTNRLIFLGGLMGAISASSSMFFLTWTVGVSVIFLAGLIGGLAGAIITFRQRLKDQEAILKEQTEDLLASMTEIQSRYDEVQTLNVSLEQKVEVRTTELTEANERLQELDKLKDRFLANVSHELRTPLVALSSTLQMIFDQDVNDPIIYNKLLRSSAETLEDMLENVNDLLLKTRFEKGLIDIRWSEIEITKFVQRSLKVFDSLANKEKNKLRFHDQINRPLLVYADRAKLKKILNNLLGNALKYTQNGDVDVILEKNEDYCLIIIKDTGRGIPQAELDSIFEPFFQASNNPYREVQGTGIGLSLVKDLIELHHGKIVVDSQVSKGSQFKIFIPLGKDHVDMDSLDDSLFVEESDSRINLGLKSFDDLDLRPFSEQRPYIPSLLLIEDNPKIIQVLAYVLTDKYNLHFAKDGQEGLEKTKTLRPNLIISDIMMPRKNGYELINELKQDPDLKGIPVILLTSKADRASRIQGFEYGADEYLTKPFNNQEILIRVKVLIEKKQLETEYIHLEKMIALGQLSAGVSHEINNPIAYAKSSADTIEKIFSSIEQKKISLDDGMVMMKEAITRVREGTKRVAEITEALRGFVRQGTKGFHFHDIHSGIESTLIILHTNHKVDIQIVKRYELSEKIECNISQINQVILNLVQNAAHAVQNQLNLQIIIHTYQQQENAVIVVQDNGPGISVEILGRVFDPFFTTKELGQGTGLGLHICKQIIDEHNGTLSLKNHEDGGVQCKIILPLQRKGAMKHARFTHKHVDRRVEEVHYPHRR